MIRGAVYRVDLGAPRGHEQGGRRYGLVLSPSEMNWSVATVVPTSTSARPATFRPELVIDGQQTVLLVDQIRTVDTAYLVGDPVDYLNHDELTTVEQAVIHYLGLV
ncbi:type II toxin-antitoxin system PemK/MazF family toxin [Oerskovia turbata]|uniref:Type II toxin-antitoxin system PemK/MazF family toxin n=1 Tax=Oerskovia turbata TaxID=1713 RepID=A0A4Q1KPZ0_9CELL|nr:type II toxin-antitoxin system PemK/MazF family toxin [Oerskovia turbata]RXR22735.1 type II toxin-antitoxin system PemK/MazF family toxin [Oerskovia turbata]RXR32071.1 type II toxin-antitoxin system PemK/MazF family toxin [Oerskovia turbata]TGJ96038.1 growth inhibitor PemK [Actinotalea fermentans ATCC 43279 = JCM 9966 = DSM 3133]